MALKLNDEVDKRWAADVRSRNEQQVETMKNFKEKCVFAVLADFSDYAAKTEQQMKQYQDLLMKQAREETHLEAKIKSKIRRTKIACLRGQTISGR